MANTVLEEDHRHRVTYRIMSVLDVPRVVLTLVEAFFQSERITAVCGCTRADQIRFMEMYIPRMAVEGSSVVAVDSDSGELLGAFVNEDFANEDPPGMSDFPATAEGDWAPLLSMIGALEEHLAEEHGIPSSDRPRGRWLHLWMLGVASSASGRQIGRKLAQHSIDLAERRGFVLAFAECTGAVSTHILTKHGRQHVAHFMDYATFAGEGESANAVRNLPSEGHAGMSLTVSLFPSER